MTNFKTPEKPKCLVTGATGFLGTNLVHELVRQGWDVRASGRSDNQYLDGLNIEFAHGDITNKADVDRIVAGCDIVFHVAADTSFWNRQYKKQWQINVEGSTNIAEACIKHGVKRLVHTSTIDVLGYNPNGGSFDEISGQYNFDNMDYNYGDSKHEADLRLQSYKSQLDIVTIYPGFMIGPFDFTLQIGRVFFDLAKGTMPGSPNGGGSFCHVTEVAKAHIAAAIKGKSGEGYLCAGMPHSNMPFHEMFSLMAEAIDAKPPAMRIPRWALIAYGYGCELVSRFSNQAPEMNPGQARYLSCHQYGVSTKAINELNYQVPEVESCINDALAWYRDQGYKI